MILIFKTKVNHIPCYCRVDHYAPFVPDKLSGAFEDSELGSDEEFEFTILDHRYIIAPWLQKQLMDADYERLLEEFHVTQLEHKHCIEEP